MGSVPCVCNNIDINASTCECAFACIFALPNQHCQHFLLFSVDDNDVKLYAC